MIAPRLGCHSTRRTRSASSSAPATFQLPRFFSRVVCNWAARGSLLETLLACSSFLPRVFEVISQLSHTCVKAFSRGGKHRPGNSHWQISTEWNASRMRWTNTCDPRPISAASVVTPRGFPVCDRFPCWEEMGNHMAADWRCYYGNKLAEFTITLLD